MQIRGEAAMRLLRNTLRANAAFSTLSGLTMVVGGAELGAWLGRSGSVALDGAVLLGFAGYLLVLTRKPEINLKAAWVVVVLDLIWVVDSVAKMAASSFSSGGNAFYGVASLVVLAFAIGQTIGILGSGRSADYSASSA